MSCTCPIKILAGLALLCLLLCPRLSYGQAEENMLSIDFVDANIHDVIRVLAAARDLNLIVGPEVGGSVTIKLKDVSLETALDAVVGNQGYQYRIANNLLKVDTLDNFSQEDASNAQSALQEQLLTIVFTLKYINGVDVVDLLKTQLTPRGQLIPLVNTQLGSYSSSTVGSAAGQIQLSTRAGTKIQEVIDRVVVIDTVQGISLVKKLLDELDVLPEQILISTKMLETQFNHQNDLGIRWEFLGSGDDGSGGLRIGGKTLSQQLTKTFSHEDTLTDNDITQRRQELADVSAIPDVETDIPDYISENYFNPPAVDIFNNLTATTTDVDGLVTSHPTSTLALSRNKTSTDLLTLGNEIERITAATLSASDFEVILNALKARGGTEIISNPSILTRNNHEATILVGERYPIIQSTVTDAGTVTQTFDHYEPVGIQLQVLPRILHSQMVNMVIRPSVTSIGGLVGSSALSINRINTREATTQLIIPSGDTIMIGGLLSDETTKSGNNIPFIGKLPLIGKLFSYKHDSNAKIELTIFVTPEIIKAHELANKEK